MARRKRKSGATVNQQPHNPSDLIPDSCSLFLKRHWRFFTTDHRTIGIQYLILALISVTIGVFLSLLMRIHLVWPNLTVPFHGPILPEDYLALVTIHGTIMLFFVLTTAPQSGFGNLILPAQIGSRRMAFPVANAIGFWLTAAALVILLSSTFVPGGSAISGWTAYPPFSAVASAGPGQGPGMDLWLASIAVFCIASTIGAINTLVTIIKFRCQGMTWDRMPLTVWGWFTAALLSVIAFSVLLAALLLLFCDRHAGTSFFIPAGDLISGTLHAASHPGNGSPLLWLHLFWFFGHPEVYIAILPGLGLTSMLLANFSHRRVFAYRMMIVTTLLIGFLGILLWGHHMFVAGLNPFAASTFSVSTMAIALPASAKVLSWLATVWRSRPQYTTAMLFSLGFVSLFITGGLTGPILAQPILDEYLHNTFFVVAHFHLIMAMAGIFGLFSATYYWFPLMTGRHYVRNPRPPAFLGHPYRSLRHLPPHAPHRPHGRTPPLRPALRHPQRRRTSPRRNPAPQPLHHLVRDLPCCNSASLLRESHPLSPARQARSTKPLEGHHARMAPGFTPQRPRRSIRRADRRISPAMSIPIDHRRRIIPSAVERQCNPEHQTGVSCSQRVR